MPVNQTYPIQTFFSTLITVWVGAKQKAVPTQVMTLVAFQGMDTSFPASSIILSEFVSKDY